MRTTGIADFSEIFDSQHFSPSFAAIRRACFNVIITDDDFYENTESFNVALELDTFVPQSGIRVDPSITEIFIIDNDGKFCDKHRKPTFIPFFNIIAVIGFIDAPYVAFENNSFITITFGVINGTLEREVAVSLSFACTSSSIGEFTLHRYSIVFFTISFSWRGFPSRCRGHLQFDCSSKQPQCSGSSN